MMSGVSDAPDDSERRSAVDWLMQPPSTISFPLGQKIFQSATITPGVDDPWIDFKLRSARWYLDVLEELERATGDLDRYGTCQVG